MAAFDTFDPVKIKRDMFFLDIETQEMYPGGPTSVIVFARTVSGEKVPYGDILKIDPQGRLVRFSGVSPLLGLPLDEDGRVILRS